MYWEDGANRFHIAPPQAAEWAIPTTLVPLDTRLALDRNGLWGIFGGVFVGSNLQISELFLDLSHSSGQDAFWVLKQAGQVAEIPYIFKGDGDESVVAASRVDTATGGRSALVRSTSSKLLVDPIGFEIELENES